MGLSVNYNYQYFYSVDFCGVEYTMQTQAIVICPSKESILVWFKNEWAVHLKGSYVGGLQNMFWTNCTLKVICKDKA